MIIRKLLRGLVRLTTAGFETEDTSLTRFRLYHTLAGTGRSLNAKKVASISGSERLCGVMGFDKSAIVNLDYPEHDLRALNFPDASFDACIADQVLEHIDGDPLSVVRECTRIVKPNGIVAHATVMTYPVHFGPKDLWRFTPEGLSVLFERSGLSILQSGCWGGPRAVILLALDLGQIPVPKNRRHPIRRIALNSGDNWPVVVWIVGEKKSQAI
jgi:SAM-dependent methyltransferase